MLLEIDSSIENNIGVLKLNGVLDLSTVEIFKNSLEKLPGSEQIIIDFDQIKFIDSTGIGSLAQYIKKIQIDKVGIKITNISKDVFEVLDILGLPEIFGEEIFEIKQD